MLRIAILMSALALPTLALACGEGSNCAENCKMKSEAEQVEVDIAAAEGTKATFDVTGMKCGACASKIQAALLGVDGVNAASVSSESGKAQVAFDADKTNLDALVAAVSALGGHFEAKVAPVTN